MSSLVRQIYNATLSYETRLWLYKLRHPGHYGRLRTIVQPSPKGDFSLRAYDQHQCIFIHITKSAGTSISRSLFGYLPYHHTAIDYRVIFGRRTFNQYFKFAFVRNPWDRLYSAYRYLRSGGWNETDKLWAETSLEDFGDFNCFVKQWLTPRNIDSHIHFWPQYRFVCDSKGRLLVDYLGYFETLHSDIRKVSARLGIDASLARYNAGPESDYRTVYDDAARDVVAQVYAQDIKLFGYEFGGIRNRTVIGK